MPAETPRDAALPRAVSVLTPITRTPVVAQVVRIDPMMRNVVLVGYPSGWQAWTSPSRIVGWESTDV